ncbi:MAG: LAGLIDADG family homing endonuclease [Candidatus Nanoarchaeia archaeon]|jgi:DNA-binding transcriptional ArsR family regulator
MRRRICFNDFAKTYGENHNFVKYYPAIIRLNKKGISLISVEKIYKGKIPKSTLYFWYNQKRVPVQFTSFVKAKKSFSEKEIDKMGELIGSIMGDGGIISKGHVHYCNTEQFLINRFKANMLELFPKETPCESKDNNAMHLIYSPRIGRVLWCLFGRFSYGKDTKNITSQINNQPLAWKIKAVQALYNDEGSVIMTKNNTKYISFKQKSTSVTDFVCSVLNECGIRYIRGNDDGKWMVRICGYENMLKFKERIGFSDGYRKAEKLNRLLNSINHPHFITKQKILEILKEGPKTYKDIAQSFILNPRTVRGHLHGWTKGSIKESLIKMGLVKAMKQGRKQVYSLA